MATEMEIKNFQDHFRSMCLNDQMMQRIYRGDVSWAEASEDTTPLELDGWREYLKRSEQPNAWAKPLVLPGSKRRMETPPPSPEKKKERVAPPAPKNIPVISEADQGKQTLFIRDIPKDVTNKEITAPFEPFGAIHRFYRSVERCFAIIRFKHVADAQRAYLAKLNQFTLKGKPRKISFAEIE